MEEWLLVMFYGARPGCYVGLWCVSGLSWGIPNQVKNVLIFCYQSPKIYDSVHADGGPILVSFITAISFALYSNFLKKYRLFQTYFDGCG